VQEIGSHGVDGLVSGAWWTPLVASSADGQVFLTAFRQRYHREPEAYEAVGYEAARTLFAAIEKAGSFEPEAVRSALVSLEIPSILPGGKLSFPAANGQQAQGIYVLLQNQPDGSIALIYPRAFATREGSVASCPAGGAAAGQQ
jgi:branched-chain amino acid transport system substrate-binding protein